MATVTSAAMTVEEFSRLPRDGARHEMNAGKLITMPPPKSLHTLVALAVLERLQVILKDQPLWRAIPEAGYILSRSPVTIRQPEVSVLSRERIRTTAGDDYFEGAPELAVEVVSPRNSDEDLDEKVQQYLSAGARSVWVVYPNTQSVTVWNADGNRAFSGNEVLPEFPIKVSELFR